MDDDRDDDTPYPEIQESYFGRPFTLNTKGLSYRVGDKKANQMQRLRINWGQRAGQRLMGRAGLMHEIEAATAATTVGNYATTNRITLSVGSQFNEPDVDPDPVIRGGKSAIASQIGIDPNVMVLGRDVYDVIATRYSRSFTATSAGGGLRPQLTEEILADIFGFARGQSLQRAEENRNRAATHLWQAHRHGLYQSRSAQRRSPALPPPRTNRRRGSELWLHLRLCQQPADVQPLSR